MVNEQVINVLEGIGTTSPDHKLRVNGDTRLGNLHIKTSDFGVGGTGKTIYADGAGSGVLGFISTTAFDFSNGSTSRMHINSSGQVGIGTTSPDTLLHIYNPSTAWGAYSTITLGTDVGGTNQAQLKYYRGASTSTESFQLSVRGTTSLTALYNGNVGIGTTSPDYKLEVNGGTDNVVALFESTDNKVYIGFKDNGTTSIPYVGADEMICFFLLQLQKECVFTQTEEFQWVLILLLQQQIFNAY